MQNIELSLVNLNHFLAKLFKLAFFILVSGCVSVQTPQFTTSAPVTNFTIPAIEEQSTAFIGETLISQGVMVETNAIKLNAAYRTEWVRNSGGRAFPFVFDQGTVLKQIGTMEGVPLYVGKSTGGILATNGAQINAPYGIAATDNGDVKYVYVGGGTIPETPGRTISYSKAKQVDIDDRNFKYEFLYNGRNETELFFTYREFTNDMARPAFTQNVRYSVAESNTIGFKTLMLEVIRATNQDITYIIKRGFE